MRYLLLGILFALLGCGPAQGTTAEAVFRLSQETDPFEGEAFLDHPFPSDFRRDANGFVDFSGMHNPRANKTVAELIATGNGLLDGFSPAAAGYLRFSAGLDPKSLPQTAAESLEASASVLLINVDPQSPRHLQRHPIDVSFRATGTVYTLPNTLRWMPAIGFPLRPHTRYAVVVRTTARSFDGGSVQANAQLKTLLETSSKAAQGPYPQAVAASMVELSKAALNPKDIAHLSVFTTADPTGELLSVRDHLRQHYPAPSISFRNTPEPSISSAYVEYQGSFGPLPNYQHGTLPFTAFGDGGGFRFENGEPVVADSFSARFSLAVPNKGSCPMPEAGYPIVLYAHGTGGNWRSYVRSGYATFLARKCLATMGVDQIFHGLRPGVSEDSNVGLLFFNFRNIVAARTNGRQSALDEVQRARLFSESQSVIPATIALRGSEIRFDASKILFFGHSQGGLNGPLYLAADDSARGGVLSGSGSLLALTLLEKTEPAPSIADLVKKVFLGLTPDEYPELDIFHPVLSLAQNLLDTVDPIHYARLSVREPRPGFAAKSILMTEGIGSDGLGDSYTPPRGTEAQALAMGLPPQQPVIFPIKNLNLSKLEPLKIPTEGLSGNLAMGTASGVLAQWAPKGDDGHFVIFDLPEAREQVVGFLNGLAADPAGFVPAP